jgi:hypothetical protein
MDDKKALKQLFEASYDDPNKAKERLANLGYKADEDLSTSKAKVFTDPQGNPIILHRGTELGKGWKTALSDIGTDIQIGLGKTPKRLTEAKRITKQVQEKYGQPTTAIGTSMGGFLAEKSGADKTITYNKAVAPQDIFKRIPKSQKDYRTATDIISLPSVFQKGSRKTIKLLANPLKAHSVSSFR